MAHSHSHHAELWSIRFMAIRHDHNLSFALIEIRLCNPYRIPLSGWMRYWRGSKCSLWGRETPVGQLQPQGREMILSTRICLFQSQNCQLKLKSGWSSCCIRVYRKCEYSSPSWKSLGDLSSSLMQSFGDNQDLIGRGFCFPWSWDIRLLSPYIS